ncbi:MAG TPA: hypothetical protein PK733_14305 [Clostridiales bacterium]|nr:hypothetical protein [Clostridiales bacterium]
MEKIDKALELIEKLYFVIQDSKSELKGEIQDVRTELKSDIQDVRTELQGEIQSVRTELKEEIQGVRTELKSEINKIQITLENDIKPDIKCLYEGYSQVYKKVENIEVKVDEISQKVKSQDVRIQVIEGRNKGKKKIKQET